MTRSQKGWERLGPGGDLPIHVYPLGDLREHETDGEGCWCRPAFDYSDDGDLIVIHNALDRREEFETGARKPS
jgi:hypothetical protein